MSQPMSSEMTEMLFEPKLVNSVNPELNEGEIEIEEIRTPIMVASQGPPLVFKDNNKDSKGKDKHPMQHAAEVARDLSKSLDTTMNIVHKSNGHTVDVAKSAPVVSTSEKPASILNGAPAGMNIVKKTEKARAPVGTITAQPFLTLLAQTESETE